MQIYFLQDQLQKQQIEFYQQDIVSSIDLQDNTIIVEKNPIIKTVNCKNDLLIQQSDIFDSYSKIIKTLNDSKIKVGAPISIRKVKAFFELLRQTSDAYVPKINLDIKIDSDGQAIIDVSIKHGYLVYFKDINIIDVNTGEKMNQVSEYAKSSLIGINSGLYNINTDFIADQLINYVRNIGYCDIVQVRHSLDNNKNLNIYVDPGKRYKINSFSVILLDKNKNILFDESIRITKIVKDYKKGSFLLPSHISSCVEKVREIVSQTCPFFGQIQLIYDNKDQDQISIQIIFNDIPSNADPIITSFDIQDLSYDEQYVINIISDLLGKKFDKQKIDFITRIITILSKSKSVTYKVIEDETCNDKSIYPLKLIFKFEPYDVISFIPLLSFTPKDFKRPESINLSIYSIQLKWLLGVKTEQLLPIELSGNFNIPIDDSTNISFDFNIPLFLKQKNKNINIKSILDTLDVSKIPKMTAAQQYLFNNSKIIKKYTGIEYNNIGSEELELMFGLGDEYAVDVSDSNNLTPGKGYLEDMNIVRSGLLQLYNSNDISITIYKKIQDVSYSLCFNKQKVGYTLPNAIINNSNTYSVRNMLISPWILQDAEFYNKNYKLENGEFDRYSLNLRSAYSNIDNNYSKRKLGNIIFDFNSKLTQIIYSDQTIARLANQMFVSITLSGHLRLIPFSSTKFFPVQEYDMPIGVNKQDPYGQCVLWKDADDKSVCFSKHNPNDVSLLLELYKTISSGYIQCFGSFFINHKLSIMNNLDQNWDQRWSKTPNMEFKNISDIGSFGVSCYISIGNVGGQLPCIKLCYALPYAGNFDFYNGIVPKFSVSFSENPGSYLLNN